MLDVRRGVNRLVVHISAQSLLVDVPELERREALKGRMV